MKTRKTQENTMNLSRRKFIGQAATGSAFVMLTPLNSVIGGHFQETANWPAGASDFRVHMIGHAHIDPVWLWPWPEGMAVVYSTFRSALDRMNETPDFTFTASSAQFYQWIADNDPLMLKEIKKTGG